MDVELRPVSDEEVPAFIRAVEGGFGEPSPSDEEVAHWAALTEVVLTVVAVHGGEFVGTAGAFTFEWTVPGPAVVPAAGVTAVTVRTDCRRRGVLTRMMDRLLTDAVDRGEPVAILEASEGIIYGRFGYGAASFHAELRVGDRAEFRPDTPTGGTVRVVPVDEAKKVLPGLHDGVRAATSGDLARREVWWQQWFEDRRDDRRPRSAGGRFYAVHDDERGRPDGYAAYRVHGEWTDGNPNGTVHVEEVVATGSAAYVGLWRHLLDVDLTRKVVTTAPVDEPLRWMLTDPRQVATLRLQDFLWARILDVPAALGARRYGAEGTLTIEVVDPSTAGWAAGRFQLKASTDGASIRRVRTKPDLTFGVAELGAVYLGGTTVSSLVRAGRVGEHRRGAAARADSVFRTDAAPYTRTHF